MSVVKKVSLSLAAATAVGLALVSWNAAAASPRPFGRVAAAPSLSSADAAGLAFSREEERMAHDLYTVFGDKYSATNSTTVFTRIAASEQRHFDAVGVLLQRYSVSDPAAGAKAGVYTDANVQKLYDAWKAQGLTSVKAAYQVGVALEQRDIADLQRLQTATTNTDLDRLYANLEAASKHHQAAFTAAANGQPMPTGNGPATGRGNGPGAGPGTGPGSGPRDGTGAGRGQRGGMTGQNRGSCLNS